MLHKNSTRASVVRPNVYKPDNLQHDKNVHSNFWSSQLTAAVTNVSKLLHDSPAFKPLTLDLVVDVIVLELSEPTFWPPKGTLLYKFVFCTMLFSELAN